MDIKLRSHQELAINMIRKSFSTNQVNSDRRISRVMVSAPCGAGKTVLAAKIMQSAAANGTHCIFIADRIKLIDQTVETLDRYGIDCGVIQAQHPRTNPSKIIQVASIKTLMSLRNLPVATLVIFDEAHTVYEYALNLMKKHDKCRFIGLSATPYTKGLGKIYHDLVIPTTTQRLLDDGHLCPLEYLGGARVDMSMVRSAAGEFRQDDLVAAIDKDEVLTGSIVNNWKRFANGRMMKTIAFTPSIDHSKGMVELFRENGISAEHIDCRTSAEDRQILFDSHSRGEFCLLSCSQLLNTGYDEEGIEYIIDAYPVKSLITYQQRGGRGMRTSEGKTHCYYADHAANVERHGFIEDIEIAHLSDGEKKESQESLTKEKKETESKVKKCPRCYQEYTGFKCACGFEIPITKRLADDGTELVQLKPSKPLSKMTAAEKRGFQHSVTMKDQFKSELMRHALLSGYQDGWVFHNYQKYYGEAPNRYATHISPSVSPATKKWLQGQNIRRAKGNAA